MLRRSVNPIIRNQAIWLLKYACAVGLVFEFVGGPKIVKGPSMLPTMHSQECVLVFNFPIRFFANPGLKRGDIIVAKSPLDPNRMICKRIIGLEGDVICVDPTIPSSNHVFIPKGHIWLQGDNFAMSRDSRNYGPVPMGLVKSKVVARIWPSPALFRNPMKDIG